MIQPELLADAQALNETGRFGKVTIDRSRSGVDWGKDDVSNYRQIWSS